MPNLDFMARRTMALAPALDASARAEAAGAILAAQNADGGFGVAAGFESDALDTALTLRALATLGPSPDSRVSRALQALGGLRSTSGGWPIVPGGDTSTVVTAHALLA